MKSFVFMGIMIASLLFMLSISMAETEENNMTLPDNNSTEMNATLPGNASMQDNQSNAAVEAPDTSSESSSSSC